MLLYVLLVIVSFLPPIQLLQIEMQCESVCKRWYVLDQRGIILLCMPCRYVERTLSTWSFLLYLKLSEISAEKNEQFSIGSTLLLMLYFCVYFSLDTKLRLWFTFTFIETHTQVLPVKCAKVSKNLLIKILCICHTQESYESVGIL